MNRRDPERMFVEAQGWDLGYLEFNGLKSHGQDSGLDAPSFPQSYRGKGGKAQIIRSEDLGPFFRSSISA